VLKSQNTVIIIYVSFLRRLRDRRTSEGLLLTKVSTQRLVPQLNFSYVGISLRTYICTYYSKVLNVWANVNPR
jgi:hypothetical protein